jgi:hypothetical protein
MNGPELSRPTSAAPTPPSPRSRPGFGVPDPAGGAPAAFLQTPGATWVALAFFIVLVCAALTSALSLLEVITAYFVDEFALSRVRAAFLSKRISSLTYYL